MGYRQDPQEVPAQRANSKASRAAVDAEVDTPVRLRDPFALNMTENIRVEDRR
jgi:hypothetical protein